MRIYNSIDELVGKTPLLSISRFADKAGVKNASVFAKLEYLNPAGSVKDRAALYMINDAEKSGKIAPGAVIIEPTSGNTGIGLCAISAARDYKAVIVMPDTMSRERILLMQAYGAEVVLTDGKYGMGGAIKKARELAEVTPNSFIPDQFENPANPAAHYDTTGPEIWEDTGGDIDFFIAGVGTGGTVSGVGKYLKEKKPDIKIIAVEPKDSPVLSGGSAGAHGLQGIGAGFIPGALDTNIYDEVITVRTDEAFEAARLLAKTEGILVGISSGAALCAAAAVAKRNDSKGKKIAVLLPDTGDRYLSTKLFNKD